MAAKKTSLDKSRIKYEKHETSNKHWLSDHYFKSFVLDRNRRAKRTRFRRFVRKQWKKFNRTFPLINRWHSYLTSRKGS